jgi:hypothetical protein
MKDKDEFLKQMESLQVPQVDPAKHQQMVKMAIMNAGRSATLGVWLIVVPCYFLLCVCMYYYFHVHTTWFGALFQLITSLDKTPGFDFMAPVVLFVLPIIAIVVNSLAITHFQFNGVNKVKEFNITIKIKFLNILLILISLLIIGVFISFTMVQDISISN